MSRDSGGWSRRDPNCDLSATVAWVVAPAVGVAMKRVVNLVVWLSCLSLHAGSEHGAIPHYSL